MGRKAYTLIEQTRCTKPDYSFSGEVAACFLDGIRSVSDYTSYSSAGPTEPFRKMNKLAITVH